MVQAPASSSSQSVDIARLVEADREHLIHPLYHPADHARPMVVVRGEGAEIIDAEGKRYFDALSGLWNVHVGHGRGELAQVAAEQMATLAFNNNYVGFVNVPSTRLAEKLAEIAYPNLNAVYFTTGGAESNESAFKTARFYWKLQGQPRKVKIISRRWGYHGVTMAAASATGLPAYHKMFSPLVPDFIQAVGPYRFRCELEGEDGPRPCTSPATHDYAAELEQTLIEQGPESVAAILGEPVQGAGGVIVPPDEYWPRLREIADRHNVLLIADEVITGFGRTGKWFALEHWGVQPDIMSFAKGITSAYLPLGGILVSRQVQDAINQAPADLKYMHAATYSGHAVCCAVGLANLAIIEREGLVERAARVGAWFQQLLRQTLEPLAVVGQVRGIGMMAAVELVDPSASGSAFYDNAVATSARVVDRCLERGVLPRRLNNTICLAPPLISTEAQLQRLVETLAESIAAEDR
ncbi:MAG: aspartate aminotransferase family protein [Chloroflexota bacterium]|nr:aspartate aminotransferase family protein [Chloroflexota bacterium]